jgi:hypothetical protein
MNRILEIPPEKLSSEQSKVFDQLTAGRGRILGPYKIWIHSPTVASGMERIGTFLNKFSSLSRREVEIGILVIAQHWQGDYVRQAHIREGKAAGLSQEAIDAILAGMDPKLADAHERRPSVCRGAGKRCEAVGHRIRGDRTGARPRGHRGSARPARLLHLGCTGDEGARGADSAAIDPPPAAPRRKLRVRCQRTGCGTPTRLPEHRHRLDTHGRPSSSTESRALPEMSGISCWRVKRARTQHVILPQFSDCFVPGLRGPK